MNVLNRISLKIRNIISHEIRKELLGFGITVGSISVKNRDHFLFDYKADQLTRETLHSIASGVSDLKLCKQEVIISLTSYGKRLKDVYLAIESIMQGSIKPNRIILWLADDIINEILPITLQNQQKRGLEIRYCKDTHSYKKLIPSLIEFPEACIITIDDDVIYSFDFLENMLVSYQKNPLAIHANRVHTINMVAEGVPSSYALWGCCNKVGDASIYNFATGVGGILYPPHCFSSHVFDEHVFLDICPTADDIWFFAMGHLNGYFVQKVFTRNILGNDYIENPEVQDVALKNINKLGEHRNDIQMKSVLSKYGLTLKDEKN